MSEPYVRYLRTGLAQAKRALSGDSNDAEHDALYDLVEILEYDDKAILRIIGIHEELLALLELAVGRLQNYGDGTDGERDDYLAINSAIARARAASRVTS